MSESKQQAKAVSLLVIGTVLFGVVYAFDARSQKLPSSTTKHKRVTKVEVHTEPKKGATDYPTNNVVRSSESMQPRQITEPRRKHTAPTPRQQATSTSMTFLGIPLSFDPAASLLSVIALYIAWMVYRATTMHRGRINSVDSSYSHNITGHSYQLNVVIRNTGLPIQNASVHLAVLRNDRDGRRTNAAIQLGKTSDAPFEHGAIGKFEFIVPYPLSPDYLNVAQWLTCFVEQSRTETKPRIVINSGEFEVVSIDLVSRFDWFVRRWNRFAFRINCLFDRQGTYSDGQTWIKSGHVLPTIGLRAWGKLEFLGRSMSRELSKSESGDDKSINA